MNIEQIIDAKALEILESTSGKREQKNQLEAYGLTYGINLNKRDLFDDMVIALKQHALNVGENEPESSPQIVDVNVDVCVEEEQIIDGNDLVSTEHDIVEHETIVQPPASVEHETKLDKHLLNKFHYRLLFDKTGSYFFADLHERFITAYAQFISSDAAVNDFTFKPEYMSLSKKDLDDVNEFVKLTHQLKQLYRVKLRGSRNGNIVEI